MYGNGIKYAKYMAKANKSKEYGARRPRSPPPSIGCCLGGGVKGGQYQLCTGQRHVNGQNHLGASLRAMMVDLPCLQMAEEEADGHGEGCIIRLREPTGQGANVSSVHSRWCGMPLHVIASVHVPWSTQWACRELAVSQHVPATRNNITRMSGRGFPLQMGLVGAHLNWHPSVVDDRRRSG